MGIKHNPGGLFPHFDSGIERIPFLVKQDEPIELGCRLDEKGEDAKVSIKISGNKGVIVENGVLSGSNDLRQKYFKFTPNIDGYRGTVSYKFICSDGETSSNYAFNVLNDIILRFSQIEHKEGCIKATYLGEGMVCYFTIHSEKPIKFSFAYYLNDKVESNKAFSQIDANPEKEFVRVLDNKTGFMCLSKTLKLLIDDNKTVYNIEFDLKIPGSAIFGLGEKFDKVNQVGKKPLNYVVEQYAHQMNKTYLPVPFFFTDGGIGFFYNSTWKSEFDFSNITDNGEMVITVTSRCPNKELLFEGYIFEGSPADIIKAYTDQTGKPALPPNWSFGPWMSSNGWNTQKEALEQIKQMNALCIPASVMVLEAWSDEETFYIWNDAIYEPKKDGTPFKYSDFKFVKEGKWPDPKGFIDYLKENNVRLILWQIPVVKYEKGPHGKQLDYDETFAVEHGYCIKKKDGTPYRITEMWFGNSLMPDFTNPGTCKWWFDKRKYLVEELGVAGFKTDGGEFLFDLDSSFFDGRNVDEGHNAYPNLYEGAYYEFMNKTMGEGQGVLFSRAGYSGCQKYPIHWAGDQVSEFSELKGQLTAGLSAGLSGIPFWGFDIGGFAGPFPTTELFLRSTAMATFAPIMQFHSEPRYGQYYMTERNHWNNDRSPWNMAEANKDSTIIEIYRLFANLRMNLMPYICQEAKHSSDTSRPLMAHLVYDYLDSDGDEILNIEDEYMFGRDILVAPIIEENMMERNIYLPKGVWFDFWTGNKKEGGKSICCRCDLDRIPVFVKENTLIPININSKRCMGTISTDAAMSNNTQEINNLGFLFYGEKANYVYKDPLGAEIAIRIKEGSCETKGNMDMAEIYHMTEEYLTNVEGVKLIYGHIFGKKVPGLEIPPAKEARK